MGLLKFLFGEKDENSQKELFFKMKHKKSGNEFEFGARQKSIEKGTFLKRFTSKKD